MNFTLLDLDTISRQVGRMSVFYKSSYWSPGSDISLTHLGDTEGAIEFTRNEDYNHLTAPEVTGPAKLDTWYRGEDPVVTIPLWFADSALLTTISPNGTGSAGYERARRVTYRTLVLFPEQLLYDDATNGYKTLSFTGSPGAWKLNGVALDTDHQQLLAHSVWFWKGYFGKPDVSYQDEDGRRALASVTFQVVRHSGMPNGEQLYTVGDPQTAGIDIEPVTSP